MNNTILTKINDFDNRNYRNKALKFRTAQQMIHKLLMCDRLEKIEVKRTRYTKQELANKLSIDLEELMPFTGNIIKSSMRKTGEMDLRLIKLYLNTKLVANNS